MKTDILEQGAIVQRDGETFAIAPHIPGGFIEVTVFKRLGPSGWPSSASERKTSTRSTPTWA